MTCSLSKTLSRGLLLLATLSLPSCGSEHGTLVEIGRICVRGEVRENGEMITSLSPIRFEVYPKGCWASGCTSVYEASCSVAGDHALSLTGRFELAETGYSTCLADCGGGGLAQCNSESLQPGEYTVTSGDMSLAFTVPGLLPWGGICSGDPFDSLQPASPPN